MQKKQEHERAQFQWQSLGVHYLIKYDDLYDIIWKHAIFLDHFARFLFRSCDNLHVTHTVHSGDGCFSQNNFFGAGRRTLSPRSPFHFKRRS